MEKAGGRGGGNGESGDSPGGANNEGTEQEPSLQDMNGGKLTYTTTDGSVIEIDTGLEEFELASMLNL